MKLPFDTSQVIEYRCNICGGKNRLEGYQFNRERAFCETCGANARFRGIIHALANLLEEDESTPLKEWPIRKNIFGIGMSDWSGYANLLAKKFSYENTFYDQEPKLDILNLTETHLGKYDFVISTEVLEHILPPVQNAFDNLFRLLKPGGYLVFSVPYTCTAQTVEHYLGLRDYEILNFRGEKIMVNRDETGRLQVYDNLVFHGGEGATLEMRVFCETDILNHLARSGFEGIRVYDQPQLSIGYYWPEPKFPDWESGNYIISARRPINDFV
jgi:SAM-dependent methyltransferase